MVKDFITKYTDIFLLKKMREAFALQKAFHIFFSTKIRHISDINVRNFNETLPNDVVSFEQPGPGVEKLIKYEICLYSPTAKGLKVTSLKQPPKTH